MDFAAFRESVDAYVLQTWQLSATASAKSDSNGIFAFVSPRTGEMVYTQPPIPPQDRPFAKDLTAFMLKTLVEKLKLTHTCLITEAWMIKSGVEDEAELRAFMQTGQPYATHPKAVEVLFTHYSTAETPHEILVTYEIDRSSENPILVKSQEITDEADQSSINGRFTGMYYEAPSCK